MTRTLLLAMSLTFLSVAPAMAQKMSYGKAPMSGDTGPPAPENVGFDQKLGDSVPLDLEFTDHLGKQVVLRDLVGGKPTILVLAYYRCPLLCSQVLTGLLNGLRDAAKNDSAFVAGGPFNVITISIDPREPPGLARAKRASFIKAYDSTRAEEAPGWSFLTASHGQGTDLVDADRKIHRLADAVGFRYTLRSKSKEYQYSGETGQWTTADGRVLAEQVRDYDYAHASGIVFLSPDGKITKYSLGISYNAAAIQSGVAEARGGKVSTFAEQVSQFCFVYDDVKGHYRPTMRALGLVSLPFAVLVGFLAVRTARRAMREKPLTLPAVGEPPVDPTPNS